jgi:hypothetical protein
VFVTTSSFSSDDFRAAAEVHAELPPDYRDAVVESFLDKVGKEIDARVDARLNGLGPAAGRPPATPPPAAPESARAPRDRFLALPVASMIVGLIGSAIAMDAGKMTPGAVFGFLVVIWGAIVAINIAHSRRRI